MQQKCRQMRQEGDPGPEGRVSDRGGGAWGQGRGQRGQRECVVVAPQGERSLFLVADIHLLLLHNQLSSLLAPWALRLDGEG